MCTSRPTGKQTLSLIHVVTPVGKPPSASQSAGREVVGYHWHKSQPRTYLHTIITVTTLSLHHSHIKSICFFTLFYDDLHAARFFLRKDCWGTLCAPYMCLRICYVFTFDLRTYSYSSCVYITQYQPSVRYLVSLNRGKIT